MNRQESLEMYKIQHTKFQKTQDLQWKFNIATWTLMAASIYFFSNYYNNNPNIPLWIIIVLCVSFFFTHLLYVCLTQNSLAVSKAIWCKILEGLNLEKTIKKNIYISIESITKQHGIRSKTFWKENWGWITFQMVITMILLFTFIIVYAFRMSKLT